MFMIWLVASLLWLPCAAYMFDFKNILYRYNVHDNFMEKVARGPQADPYRYDYYRRGYDRAIRDLRNANEDLAFLLLIGVGLPGLMLAVGTALLENIDKPHKRKTH